MGRFDNGRMVGRGLPEGFEYDDLPDSAITQAELADDTWERLVRSGRYRVYSTVADAHDVFWERGDLRNEPAYAGNRALLPEWSWRMGPAATRPGIRLKR